MVIQPLRKKRFHQSVVAATDDPCLESWLAFMGNALGLSRVQPGRPFINLDIGGGTTNVAWGVAGDVLRCGCYYVGARHVEVVPGTYRVRALSAFARALFSELGRTVDAGADLNSRDLSAVLGFYVALLESVVTGLAPPSPQKAARLHCQTEFTAPAGVRDEANDLAPVIRSHCGGAASLNNRK